MKKELCIKCGWRPIFSKKRQLCASCYGRLQRKGELEPIVKIIRPINEKDLITPARINLHEREGEFQFVRNFFNHNNWIYHPAMFYLDIHKYTPDFYDGERNVFIEVSRTRQAYSANKHKYTLFKKIFPKIQLEVRKPSGQLLNEESRDKQWEQ